MATTPSNRERLLKAIPRDRQVIVAKSLERHGIDDDEPLLLLCIEILEGEARHIQNEFKRHHPILKEIYREKTWHKLLTSKIVTYIIGPLIGGAIFFGFFALSRKSENEELQRIVSETKSFSILMKEGSEAISETKEDVNAIQAIAMLMNIPEVVIGVRDQQLVVQFPKNKVTISEAGDKVVIRLTNPNRYIDAMIKPLETEEGR